MNSKKELEKLRIENQKLKTKIRLLERNADLDPLKQAYNQYLLEIVHNKKITNSLFTYLYKEDLSDTQKLPAYWKANLYTAIPELLLHEFRVHTEAKSDFTELWNINAEHPPSTFKGTISAQGISPLGDTIYLLADLGRFLRISKVLDLQPHVYLTGVNWAQYNRAVSEYGSHNLDSLVTWRKNLYQNLQIKCTAYDIDMGGNDMLSHESLSTLAHKYISFAEAILDSKFFNRKDKLSKAECKQIKTQLYDFKLIETQLFSENIDFHLNAIYNICYYLREINHASVIYYFTQMYVQYDYRDYLKIAVRSEANFDEPFYHMYLRTKNLDEKGITSALYFDYYILNDPPHDGDHEEKFVIPYYFPSGSIYETDEQAKDYSDLVIKLTDYKDTDKIKALLDKKQLIQLHRTYSDFISFLSFYAVQGTGKLSRKKFKSKIKKNLLQVDKEISTSWSYYTDDDFGNKINLWSDIFLLGQDNPFPTPYYFQVYFIEDRDLITESLIQLIQLVVEHIELPPEQRPTT